MRILLLCSAFNGLTQPAWIELRDAGHEVSAEFTLSARPSSRRRQHGSIPT
jgi:putative two-component system hydrogenase maturation factor HypX/HoxX